MGTVAIHALALDPSFRNTGWVIMRMGKTDTPIAAGVIRTKKSTKKVYAGVDNYRCSQELARALSDLIDRYKPSVVVAEAQAGSKNSRAAQLMGMGWGVISCVTFLKHVPVVQATPASVKKLVAGSNKASKKQIEDVVITRFPAIVPLAKKVKPKSLHEHIYDALAVWVACGADEVVKLLRTFV